MALKKAKPRPASQKPRKGLFKTPKFSSLLIFSHLLPKISLHFSQFLSNPNPKSAPTSPSTLKSTHSLANLSIKTQIFNNPSLILPKNSKKKATQSSILATLGENLKEEERILTLGDLKLQRGSSIQVSH